MPGKLKREKVQLVSLTKQLQQKNYAAEEALDRALAIEQRRKEGKLGTVKLAQTLASKSKNGL